MKRLMRRMRRLTGWYPRHLHVLLPDSEGMWVCDCGMDWEEFWRRFGEGPPWRAA